MGCFRCRCEASGSGAFCWAGWWRAGNADQNMVGKGENDARLTPPPDLLHPQGKPFPGSRGTQPGLGLGRAGSGCLVKRSVPISLPPCAGSLPPSRSPRGQQDPRGMGAGVPRPPLRIPERVGLGMEQEWWAGSVPMGHGLDPARCRRYGETALVPTSFGLDIPNWASWWGKARQNSRWRSPGDPTCPREGDG